MEATNRTFFEEPLIKKSSEARHFIADYGVDGERLDSIYQGKKSLRLYCLDCSESEICKGIKWKLGCERRIYLLTTINHELARQNKELRADIKNYQEVLGEENGEESL